MDKEREDFEAWYFENRLFSMESYKSSFDKAGDTGEYLSRHTNNDWEIWQARAKLSQWRPIETIPKDGTEVIVRYGRQGNVKKLVFYNTVHNFWSSKGEAVLGLMENATEWVPMPEPLTKEDEL